MEKYQFKIEDTIITTPEGWKDFEITLKRDQDISGLLITSTNDFVFKKDGYIALKLRFDANYNDKVNVSIDILQSDGTYKEQYKGVVILVDVEFNLEKLTAKATIEDASFQGAIEGNKNVKTFIDSGFTKNGEQVSVPSTFNMDYFRSNGSYNPVITRSHMKVLDTLDFLVRFMTDDEVKGVQSIYLDDVNKFEGSSLLFIITGEEMRLGSAVSPNISFSQLMTFLQRTYDLTFDFVEDSNGDPVMRIEEREFFFDESPIDTIRDLKDLTLQIDANKIASHLEVGNNTAFDSGNCSATTRFFSFQKEDYALRGKGNIDGLIDLTTDFITDSNVIEEIINSNNDAFDDDVFIVLADFSITRVTQFQSVDFCSNNPFYNQGFLNSKIIDRQISSIPNSLSKYLTGATTPSKSELGADIVETITTSVPLPIVINTQVNLTDEQYDLGNNYNTSDPNNTFYDIPFPGKFSFEISVKLIYVILTSAGAGSSIKLNPQMFLQRFDSSFSLPAKEVIPTGTIIVISGGNGTQITQTLTISSTMDCAGGDRIRVVVATAALETVGVAQISLNIIDTELTFFKCLGSDEDAGTYKVFDPNSFRAKQYRFEKNLSLTRTDNIRSNTRSSLIINELSDTALDKEVWIEDMVNNIETGATSFTMIN